MAFIYSGSSCFDNQLLFITSNTPLTIGGVYSISDSQSPCVTISGLTEKELLNLFSESSIFLSFSELEGCPAPPLEAAFSGNLVVGYTGEGADEYFKKPIFCAVHNGNFKKFIEEILIAIDKCEKNYLNSNEHIIELSKIKNDYSQKNELEHLINFAKNFIT